MNLIISLIRNISYLCFFLISQVILLSSCHEKGKEISKFKYNDYGYIKKVKSEDQIPPNHYLAYDNEGNLIGVYGSIKAITEFDTIEQSLLTKNAPSIKVDKDDIQAFKFCNQSPFDIGNQFSVFLNLSSESDLLSEKEGNIYWRSFHLDLFTWPNLNQIKGQYNWLFSPYYKKHFHLSDTSFRYHQMFFIGDFEKHDGFYAKEEHKKEQYYYNINIDIDSIVQNNKGIEDENGGFLTETRIKYWNYPRYHHKKTLLRQKELKEHLKKENITLEEYTFEDGCFNMKMNFHKPENYFMKVTFLDGKAKFGDKGPFLMSSTNDLKIQVE